MYFATSPTRTAVTILLDDGPRRAMQAHALTHKDREVIGFLVGRRPEKQPDGYYVVEVRDYIPSAYQPRSNGSVTITPDVWHYAQTIMNKRHRDHLTVMLGWAHTHPGSGLFFSQYDRYLHGAYFKQAWQIAAVIDPLAHDAGFFAWDAGQGDLYRHEFYWQWA
jgi:proteasome lid subunit RPN8/RPN11